MFKFPENLYSDVRIEDVYETKIVYNLGEVEEAKTRKYKGAFIRVFDGQRWYYSSTSNITNIQNELETLASYAILDEKIMENSIVKKFQIHKEKLIKFEKDSIEKIAEDKKHELLKNFFSILKESKFITNWTATYVDKRVVKSFYSSKGSEIVFDTQTAGFSIYLHFSHGEKKFSESFQKGYNNFYKLHGKEKELKSFIKKCEEFLLNSRPIEAGQYTVILSPLAAGIFAHESFGHKSESDFMLGNEAMKKEWAVGEKVGSEILSIVDDGNIEGTGYTPFDDEGTKAEKTYLIRTGTLSGRLHNATTAYHLNEDLTGNARAVNFEFEPIVRMTNTFIEGGSKTKEELFSEVEDGIYIEKVKHGSGMSTFTIAPSVAYRIRDGKIAEPVNISVVTGNVMETLKEIDGLSNEVELLSSVLGGCGKMEQWPLPVGFGGPYVRVKKLNAY